MDSATVQIPVYIADIKDIAPDIRILHLRLDGGARLDFKAGQYVWLGAEGQETRAFSIASAPEDPLIELHIRSAGHGISAYVMTLEVGAALTLRGPAGMNVLREGAGPLLVLAGGIGIAPMKAIVESRLKMADDAPLYLYWGVREASQLYLDDLFKALAATHPRFKYVSVPQDTDGFIGAALARDFEDLAAVSIYLAGPKPMIEATMPALMQKGARRDHIFSDAF